MRILGRGFFVLALVVVALLIGGGRFSVLPARADQASASCSPCQNCCQTCGHPQCGPGQIDYYGTCLPNCPTGFIRYPGFPGVCLPPCNHGCPEGYEPVPLPACPDGYHRSIVDPDLCAPDPVFEESCGPGLHFNPETLTCTVDCPAGTYLGGDLLCHSVFDHDCPEGYVRNPASGLCQPTGTWVTGGRWYCLPLCPPGTYRDFRYPARCIPPPPSCDDGYDLRNGRCVPKCPEGYRQDDYGYCEPPRPCPEGTYQTTRGECRPFECPQGTRLDPDTGQCAPPSCPPDSELIDGRCLPPCPQGTTRSVNDPNQCTPTTGGCPPTFEDVDGTCQPKCTQGSIRDPQTGRCRPISQGCPPGSEKIAGRCVPICPDGTVRDPRNPGRCKPVSQGCSPDSELIGGQCVPKCGIGFMRDPQHPTRCMRIPDRNPECPPGFIRTPNGDCVPRQVQPDCQEGWHFSRQVGRCVPDRTFTPQGDCPPGMMFSPKLQTCVRTFDRTPQNTIPELKLNPQLVPRIVPQ